VISLPPPDWWCPICKGFSVCDHYKQVPPDDGVEAARNRVRKTPPGVDDDAPEA